MDQLHLLANNLLEREKISGDEFRILMEGGTLPPLELGVDEASKDADKSEEPAAAEGEAPAEAPGTTTTAVPEDKTPE